MRIFKYGKSITLETNFTLILLVFIGILGIFIIEGGEYLGGILVLVIGDGLLGLLYINARLLLSSIGIDETNINLYIFGIKWKTLSWNEIKIVRSSNLNNIGFKNETITFLICPTEEKHLYFLKKGPIVFNDRIEDFRALFDIISKKATQFHFKIVVIGP